MTLFAHIETGQALEPWPNDSSDDYLARFPATDTSAWEVVEVPDGTKHGAHVNGDGTYTNPPTPAPPAPAPLAITKDQFSALYAANGNDIIATLAAWPFG